MAIILKVNDYYKHEFEFSQKDVENFAKASGDFNPIHLDKNYAKNTIFGKRIIHGFLGASIFSKVFGTLFPGEGTIYLRQDLKFVRPMFTDTRYIANFIVKEVIITKRRALVETIIKDIEGNVHVLGEALIQNQCIVD
jgi:3-hydroxybutyryl-CoA dehydratase